MALHGNDKFSMANGDTTVVSSCSGLILSLLPVGTRSASLVSHIVPDSMTISSCDANIGVSNLEPRPNYNRDGDKRY